MSIMISILLLSCTVSITVMETANIDQNMISIRGAGSSFATNTFVAWMGAYRAERSNFVDVRMQYAGLGSGYGIQAITGNIPDVMVEYGVSDEELPVDSYTDYPDLQLFPCLAGYVLYVYTII